MNSFEILLKNLEDNHVLKKGIIYEERSLQDPFTLF